MADRAEGNWSRVGRQQTQQTQLSLNIRTDAAHFRPRRQLNLLLPTSSLSPALSLTLSLFLSIALLAVN